MTLTNYKVITVIFDAWDAKKNTNRNYDIPGKNHDTLTIALS
jgi:hypothetical protein